MKKGVVLLLSGLLLLVVTSVHREPGASPPRGHDATRHAPASPRDANHAKQANHANHANPPVSDDVDQSTQRTDQPAEMARAEAAPPRAQGGAILSEVLGMLLWQRLDPQEDVIEFVPRTLGRTSPSSGQWYWEDGFRCWNLGVDVDQLTVAVGVGAIDGEEAYRLMVKLQGVGFPRPYEANLARIRIDTQRIQRRTVVRATVTNQMPPNKKTVDFLNSTPPPLEFGHLLMIDGLGEVLKTTFTARSLGIDGMAQRYPVAEYPRELLEESSLPLLHFAEPDEPIRERSIPDGLADTVYDSLQDAVNKESARG